MPDYIRNDCVHCLADRPWFCEQDVVHLCFFVFDHVALRNFVNNRN